MASPSEPSSASDTRSAEPWTAGRIIVNASTYNERDNIATLIDRVLAARPDLHMLVIDDDSPDGTGQIALEKTATEPRLHVLVRHGRRGLGSAILEGLHEARRRGFEIAVYMDADMSHDPDDIPRLLIAMEPPGGTPADLAIGSRRVPGGKTLGWPLSREVTSRLVCWFTRWVLGVPVRDGSGGFRAVRLSLLDRIAAPESRGYAFQEDLLWRLHRAGARIVEVPITFTDRTHGSSKADFAETRRSIGDLLRLARRTWLGC
ncbi:MAG: polyprenol monophosphomannose synthase [Planctomycetia bacterium]|nr:polyprenol monophosphomannose synthase [Planctomycetia bacterium]